MFIWNSTNSYTNSSGIHICLQRTSDSHLALSICRFRFVYFSRAEAFALVVVRCIMHLHYGYHYGLCICVYFAHIITNIIDVANMLFSRISNGTRQSHQSGRGWWDCAMGGSITTRRAPLLGGSFMNENRRYCVNLSNTDTAQAWAYYIYIRRIHVMGAKYVECLAANVYRMWRWSLYIRLHRRTLHCDAPLCSIFIWLVVVLVVAAICRYLLTTKCDPGCGVSCLKMCTCDRVWFMNICCMYFDYWNAIW